MPLLQMRNRLGEEPEGPLSSSLNSPSEGTESCERKPHFPCMPLSPWSGVSAFVGLRPLIPLAEAGTSLTSEGHRKQPPDSFHAAHLGGVSPAVTLEKS